MTLVDRFLIEQDPLERAEVGAVRPAPPVPASDPVPDAPTDSEYLAAWNESIMPMQEHGCEEGCC